MFPMSTQWGRLNSELLRQRKSWASLARFLSLEKQNVGNWKARGIPAKYLRKCAEFVDRTHEWLDLGDEAKSDVLPSDYKQKSPATGESLASGAININVNRRCPPKASDVLSDLSVLLAGVEPRRMPSVAAMLGDLTRSPNDEVLRDSLARMMAPEAFTQTDQRAG